MVLVAASGSYHNCSSVLHQKKKAESDPSNEESVTDVKSNTAGSDKVRGIRNNNPFNMIKSGNKWQGKKVSTDSVFEQFESMELGIRAGLINLRNAYYKKGLNTPENIINKYCPANGAGNSAANTAAYIQNVSKAVFGNIQSIKVSTVGKELKVAHALLTQENGYSPVTENQLTIINNKYKIF